MKRLSITPASVALLAAVAGACIGDVPSAATPTDPALAKAPAGYTALDVGALIGNYSSEAHAVNDAGDVAGFYCCNPNTRAFALVRGAAVTLGGESGMAWGMSNGSPAYVVGSTGGPVRWSLATPTLSTSLERTAAELTAGTGGAAKGVNEVGAAVGYVGANPAMWSANGTRITSAIAIPAGYVRGEGRGINDDGLAVFEFFATGSETAISRAYLRLASGVPIELKPVGTDVTSFVNDISEVVNGAVYAAGSTISSAQASRSVRWTVNVATGAILATDVLSTIGAHGLGVSDAAGIAGFIENERSLLFDAYLWRGTGVLKLAAPKGGKNARAWAMSQSGRYVAGQTSMVSGSQAVRWTIATP